MKKDGFKHRARARADGNKARSIWNTLESSATASTHRSSRTHIRTLTCAWGKARSFVRGTQRHEEGREVRGKKGKEIPNVEEMREFVGYARQPKTTRERERKRKGCSRVRYAFVYLNPSLPLSPIPHTTRLKRTRVTGLHTSRTKRAAYMDLCIREAARAIARWPEHLGYLPLFIRPDESRRAAKPGEPSLLSATGYRYCVACE